MNSIFSGLRVVDFTNNVAGPFPTALLADFGAEVIKIEKPKLGDDSRFFSPQVDGVGLPFCWNNRGKKSLVLDMADPEGIAIAKKLIATADLVVESFKPGTMKKFGLDYQALKAINPQIILCSVSAYGQSGPWSGKPGYDAIAQALSGIMDMTGEPTGGPTRVGFAIADYNAGIWAYAGIVSALYHRARTGEGQHVDVSLLDCLVAFNGMIEPAGIGQKPTRTGNHHGSLSPFGIFSGTNGTAIICAPAQGPWTALCNVMGRKDLLETPLFANNATRVKNTSALIEEIETWLKSFADIDEAVQIMDKAGVPCAKINNTNEVMENEQLKQRDMIVELEMPEGVSMKTVKARGNPLKFSNSKAVFQKAPTLGQHTEEILESLGYDKGSVRSLKAKWN